MKIEYCEIVGNKMQSVGNKSATVSQRHILVPIGKHRQTFQ